MAIRGIFYAEFDNIAGPRIVAQSPAGFISDEAFELIGEHTIVAANDVAGHVVTIAHPGFRPRAGGQAAAAGGGEGGEPGPGGGAGAPATVVAFPVSLSHSKYPRNAFIYCVGFVLPAGAPTGPYEPVLRKLGAYLHGMEVEGEFLSSQRWRGGGGAGGASPLGGLAPLLAEVRAGLNSRGECFVAVDACDTIALKLLPPLPPPPRVSDHDVPVRLADLDRLAAGGGGGVGPRGWAGGGAAPDDSGWDLTLRMILPFIDGTLFVRAIAEAADVEAPLARAAVAQLAAAGLVGLVDVFAYSNVYATCPWGLQRLMREPELQRAVARYTAAAPPPPGGALPRPDALLRVFLAFGAGSRMCDVCAQADTRGLGVDDRRLAAWGVLHGVLRRVHRFPVPVPPPHRAQALPQQQQQQLGGASGGATDAAGGGREPALSAAELALVDGTRHCDELCCRFHMGLSALEDALEAAAPGRYAYVLR